jgi:hypothetical protein
MTANSPSRETTINAAERYIFKGLVEQKPDEVPFHDDCQRIEIGMNTGRGAAHLRELLSGPIYDIVEDCYDLNWTVEGEQACVFYKQKLSVAEQPVLVATRFIVRDGLICEIEILFYSHGMMDVSGAAVEALSAA